MQLYPFSVSAFTAGQEQLSALMNHVLDNDQITLSAPCPGQSEPGLSEEELARCYCLSWQLLVSAVNVQATRWLVIRIVLSVLGLGSATLRQSVRFKHIRARFKQVRFACANCSEPHVYPDSLHAVTRLMGDFQDAFRSGRRFKILKLGIRLVRQLQEDFLESLRLEIERTGLSSAHSFQHYRAGEQAHLAGILQQEHPLTARQFHELRKIISRRIALNDTRRTLNPSAHLDAISLYLATINGLMGRMHDELVLKRVRKELDYDLQPIDLPEEIASRIQAVAQLDSAC